MKKAAAIDWFILVLLLTACQSSKQAPTLTTTLLPTFTPSPSATPIPTATLFITPVITATPIIANINTTNDLESIIQHQIYPYPCISGNFAKSPPTDATHASKLNLIEVDIQPDSRKYLVSEIAYNASGSRKAWVACNNPNPCEDKLYVQDNKSKKVYEIDWGNQTPWLPILQITWINNDILTFLQPAHQPLVIAINFDKREVLYEAVIFPDYTCTTFTPTP